MKYDFNDILIQPAVSSSIDTRAKVDPFHNGSLPIMAAPMDTVVSKDNYEEFLYNKIVPCLPRGEYLGGPKEGVFQSYSLKTFEYHQKSYGLYDKGWYLIDIANGHMEKLIEVVERAKLNHPNITLMVGNVANPETYKSLSEAGADYIRVGIGNGGGCLTTKNTGVGYPMASLVMECKKVADTLDEPAKIVADGGMKSYDDVIKALALGADYVMLGSILNKAIESAGNNYLFGAIKIPLQAAWECYKLGLPIYKKFRGMSTKEVQRDWGYKLVKTSEGVIRYRKVEYTLAKWVDNFEHYLRTAMSYSNARTLYDFIGEANFNLISENSYKRFNK